MPHNTRTARTDLQHLPSQDRAWLAALANLDNEAGRQPPASPSDEETAMHLAQARQLRHYFTRRDALEAAAPLSPDSEARMLARLRHLGALEPAPPVRRASPVQRLRAVLDWLLPSGPGANARYALVAGIALAVMVVPVLLRQGPHGQDDGYKTAPSLGQGAQLMLVTQPAQQLQQLQNALQAAGVASQAQPHERGYLLQAGIAPSQRIAVQNALSPWGLVVPQQGHLAVSIQPVDQP